MRFLFLFLILAVGCSTKQIQTTLEIPNLKFDEVDTQFYNALQNQDEQKVNDLFSKVNFKSIGDMDTTMTHAAIRAPYPIFEKVIKENPPIDKSNLFGETPLRSAVKLGKIEHVKLLLEKGANVDNRDNFDTPIFFEALQTKNMEMLRFLAKYNFNPNVTGFMEKKWQDFNFATSFMTDYIKRYKPKENKEEKKN